MRVTIQEDPRAGGIEVLIRCREESEQVRRIAARLRADGGRVSGTEGGRLRVIPGSEVLYVESVDRRTFAYTDDTVLELGLPLYEVEDRMAGFDFLRIARACVVNFARITAIEPEANGRLLATLDNGERIIVSRQYAPDVRRKLGMAR